MLNKADLYPFFGLIALQTFSPVLILIERTHLVFGIFIVAFHALSEIILKILFRPLMYLMILFFILLPSYRLIRRDLTEEKI